MKEDEEKGYVDLDSEELHQFNRYFFEKFGWRNDKRAKAAAPFELKKEFFKRKGLRIPIVTRVRLIPDEGRSVDDVVKALERSGLKSEKKGKRSPVRLTR